MNNIISHAMLLFKQIEQKFRTNSEFSLSAMNFLEIFLSFPGFPWFPKFSNFFSDFPGFPLSAVNSEKLVPDPI